MGPIRLAALLAALAVTCLLSGPAVAQQSSASYRSDNTTLSAATGTSSSAGYETVVALGQLSPSGAASLCNTGYRTSLGFLSFQRDLPVPTRLQVDKSSTVPGEVELSWSGADSEFEIYRSPSPDDVLETLNRLTVTSQCGASDNPPAGFDRTFYLVVGVP